MRKLPTAMLGAAHWPHYHCSPRQRAAADAPRDIRVRSEKMVNQSHQKLGQGNARSGPSSLAGARFDVLPLLGAQPLQKRGHKSRALAPPDSVGLALAGFRWPRFFGWSCSSPFLASRFDWSTLAHPQRHDPVRSKVQGKFCLANSFRQELIPKGIRVSHRPRHTRLIGRYSTNAPIPAPSAIAMTP